MPRLPPSLIRRASHLDQLLPRLLRECRDLDSARNELRWLRDHARSRAASSVCVKDGKTTSDGDGADAGEWRSRLRKMVNERNQGKPLQYIIGNQPFGDLEILCREGVLIPRPETESYTTRTARWILSRFRHLTRNSSSKNQNQNTTLRILDICTGTGCIPLLLHSLLSPSFPNLHIVGTDISPRALTLAKRNISHNISKGNLSSRAEQEIHLVHDDILRRHQAGNDDSISISRDNRWDVILSNPPYISPRAFRDGITKRSVRRFEPELALVPPPRTTQPDPAPDADAVTVTVTETETEAKDACARADSFYPPLLALSSRAGACLTVLECGDVEQAVRVRRLAERESDQVGTWRCDGLEDVSIPFKDGEETGDQDAGDDEGARAVVVIRERV